MNEPTPAEAAPGPRVYDESADALAPAHGAVSKNGILLGLGLLSGLLLLLLLPSWRRARTGKSVLQCPSGLRLHARVGAAITPTGHLKSGRTLRGRDLEELRFACEAAQTQHTLLGPWRPRGLLLVLRPKGRGGQNASLRALPLESALILPTAPSSLSRHAWLHELSHLRFHGPRPTAKLASALVRAIDEAVADVIAARSLGQPVVRYRRFGPSVRELAAPLRPVESLPWQVMVLGSERADISLLALRLSKLLWRRAKRAQLLGLAKTLQRPKPWPANHRAPAQVVAHICGQLPSPERNATCGILRAWLPPAFRRQEQLSPSPKAVGSAGPLKKLPEMD